MRLARSLGWSLRDVRTYMTCTELQEWRAYAELEPFGEEREDLRAAIIASTVASCFTGTAHEPAEFMPNFDGSRRRRGMSVNEMQARIKLAFDFEQQKERKQHVKPDGSCRLAHR